MRPPPPKPSPLRSAVPPRAKQLAGSLAFESQGEALPEDALSLGAEDPWVSVLGTIQQVMQADHCAIFLGRKGGKRASLHR